MCHIVTVSRLLMVVVEARMRVDKMLTVFIIYTQTYGRNGIVL